MKSYPDVDAYLADCDQWPAEIAAIRPVLLGCGLEEGIKWGKPCYSYDGANILILQEMKPYLSVMFFKGSLLDDPADLLHDQGPNSRSARRFQFTSAAEIFDLAETIADYVANAVDVEAAGLEVEVPPAPEFADELQRRLDTDPDFKAAFEALTPGRQREYNLHISGAKQAKTRLSRLAKSEPGILAGKGLRER